MAGKKLPRGITYSERERRYTGRFMIDGERYVVHGSTLKEAVDKMDSMRYEVKHGIYCKPQEETINSWFEIWLTQYKEKIVKKSTAQNYRLVYQTHIAPVIGKQRLCDIRSQAIQGLLNGLVDKGYSKTIVYTVYVIVFGMCKQAVKNQLIINNPATAVDFPKFKKKQQRDKRVMTVEEQKVFLEYAESSKYYDFYVIALQTGMRINEILALSWTDIDFNRLELHVNSTISYSRDKKERYKDTPKSESSIRDIPILPDVERIFRKRRKEQLENKMLLGELWKVEIGLENSVLTYEGGGVIQDSTIRADIRRIIKIINAQWGEFAPITPHTFRHTFATRCIEQGMPLQVLKTILGHSSLAMTADLYSHVLPNTKQREMQKIIGIF